MHINTSPYNRVSSTCSDYDREFDGFVLRDLSISDCNATDRLGGRIELYPAPEGFSVRNTQITGCTSNAGGGTYFGIDSDYCGYSTLFEYVFFDDNRAVVSYGHDIYLPSHSDCPFTTELDPFNKDTCFTNTPSHGGRASYYATLDRNPGDSNWLLLGSQLSEYTDMYVNSYSSLTDWCGNRKEDDQVCSSIYAASKQSPVRQGYPVVVLDGTYTNEKNQITFGDGFSKATKIRGDSSSSVAIQFRDMDGGFWIAVANEHELKFSNFILELYPPFESSTFDASLFSLFGVLLLSCVHLSSGSVVCTKSFLSLIGESATALVENSQFSSITKEGNGGVVSNEEATAVSSQIIFISNSTFLQCTARGGDGGALDLAIQVGTRLKIGSDNPTSLVCFERCRAEKESSVGGKGGVICLNIGSHFMPTSTDGSVNPLVQNILFGNEQKKEENKKIATGAIDDYDAPESLGSHSVRIYGGNEQYFSVLTVPSNADYSLSSYAWVQHATFDIPSSLSSSSSSPSFFSSSATTLILFYAGIYLPETLSYSIFSFSGDSFLALAKVVLMPLDESAFCSPSLSLISLSGPSEQPAESSSFSLFRSNATPRPYVQLEAMQVLRAGHTGTSGTFVSAVNADVGVISDTKLDGTSASSSTSSSSSSHPTASNAAQSSVCGWSGSLISLSSSQFSSNTATFANATQGAITLTAQSTAQLINTTFANNSMSTQASFPSARQNVLCRGEGSAVKVVSLAASSDTSQSGPMWILAKEGCAVTDSENGAISFSFAKPTMETFLGTENVTVSRRNRFAMSFTGTFLFPCELSFALAPNPNVYSSSLSVPAEPLGPARMTESEATVTFAPSALSPLAEYSEFCLYGYAQGEQFDFVTYSGALRLPEDNDSQDNEGGAVSTASLVGIVVAVLAGVALLTTAVALCVLGCNGKLCCVGAEEEDDEERRKKEQEMRDQEEEAKQRQIAEEEEQNAEDELLRAKQRSHRKDGQDEMREEELTDQERLEREMIEHEMDSNPMIAEPTDD